MEALPRRQEGGLVLLVGRRRSAGLHWRTTTMCATSLVIAVVAFLVSVYAIKKSRSAQ